MQRPDLSIHHRVASAVFDMANNIATRRLDTAKDIAMSKTLDQILKAARNGLFSYTPSPTEVTGTLIVGEKYTTRTQFKTLPNSVIRIDDVIRKGETGYSAGYRFKGTDITKRHNEFQEPEPLTYTKTGQFLSSKAGPKDLLVPTPDLSIITEQLHNLGFTVKGGTIHWDMKPSMS